MKNPWAQVFLDAFYLATVFALAAIRAIPVEGIYLLLGTFAGGRIVRRSVDANGNGNGNGNGGGSGGYPKQIRRIVPEEEVTPKDGSTAPLVRDVSAYDINRDTSVLAGIASGVASLRPKHGPPTPSIP